MEFLKALVLWKLLFLSANPDEPPDWLLDLTNNTSFYTRKFIFERALDRKLAVKVDDLYAAREVDFPEFYRALWHRANGRSLPRWIETDYDYSDSTFGWRSIHPRP